MVTRTMQRRRVGSAADRASSARKRLGFARGPRPGTAPRPGRSASTISGAASAASLICELRRARAFSRGRRAAARDGGGAGCDRRLHLGAGLRQAGAPCSAASRLRDQAGLAGDRGALGPDDRQRQEVAVVAREPRQQPGAQEGRLAGARRAEDHQEARRRGVAQAAQPVERLDDRRLAAEEDAGVLGLERAHAAIGRPVGIVLRRPREEARVEAGARQAELEPAQAGRREGDVRLRRRWQDGAEDAGRPAAVARLTSCQLRSARPAGRRPECPRSGRRTSAC